MSDYTTLIPALAWPALTTVYWVFLIVGGGLMVMSLMGGDADADLDVDLDVDVSLDGDAHAGHVDVGSLATWFSMQFVVFFCAMFGLIGVTMTSLSDQESNMVLALATGGGLAVGQVAHQTLRYLRSTSGSSTPQPRDYINKTARVTIAVGPKKKGEVALRVGRSERYIAALSKRPDANFKPGDKVAVVAYHGGVAEIVSQEEHEFMTEA